MKQLVAVIFIAFCTLSVYAQDAIIKTDFTKIEAKVTEIGSDVIKYKKFDNLEGSLYSINRDEVFKIVFKNGKEELVNEIKLQDLVDQYISVSTYEKTYEKVVAIENSRSSNGISLNPQERDFVNSFIKYWNLSQRQYVRDDCVRFGLAKEADELMAEFRAYGDNYKAYYFLYLTCSIAASAYIAGYDCMDSPTYTRQYDKKVLRTMQIANKAKKCARLDEEILLGQTILLNKSFYQGVNFDAISDQVQNAEAVARNFNCNL